jgi:hypothetical protein
MDSDSGSSPSQQRYFSSYIQTLCMHNKNIVLAQLRVFTLLFWNKPTFRARQSLSQLAPSQTLQTSESESESDI